MFVPVMNHIDVSFRDTISYCVHIGHSYRNSILYAAWVVYSFFTRTQLFISY